MQELPIVVQPDESQVTPIETPVPQGEIKPEEEDDGEQDRDDQGGDHHQPPGPDVSGLERFRRALVFAAYRALTPDGRSKDCHRSSACSWMRGHGPRGRGPCPMPAC